MLADEQEARSFVAQRCSASSLAAIDRFAELLLYGNQTQNLIAASTIENLWRRHIADSAQLLGHAAKWDATHVSRETGPWIDFGSGAGLPGLVVAIMRPQKHVILVESRRLRIRWLEQIIDELNLSACHVIGADVRKIETIQASVISARAFAPLSRLVQFCARFSTCETEWVLPKGRTARQDIADLPLSLQSRFHVKQSVTHPDASIVLGTGLSAGDVR